MSADQSQPMETAEASATTSAKPKASKGYRQKPKGNNSAQRRQDSYRERIGQKVLADYRSKRNDEHLGKLAELSLFEVPKGLSLSNALRMSVRYPVSTMGLSYAISSLYTRFARYLEPHVSVYQLLRLTFAQFEFQLYLASQQSAAYYPYDETRSFDMPSEYRTVLRAQPDNFQALVSIIETVGNVSSKDMQYIPTMPSALRGKNHFRFSEMSNLIRDWSQNESDWRDNPLPGARIRITMGTTGVLANPEDFWPPNYSGQDLRTDALAVMQALEAMRTKFERITAKCNFDGIGRPAMLVSVTDSHFGVPYTRDFSTRPDLKAAKRPRAASSIPCAVELHPLPPREYTWYSAVQMENTDFHHGAVSLVGITTSEAEALVPALRVRSKYASAQRLTDSWLTIFDWMLPKVGKSST